MASQVLQTGLLSIGVPVYNEEAYIEETLMSLLAQEYPHIEIIVSDNASTDRTFSICQRIATNDDRLCLHQSKTTRNAMLNFEGTFSQARGEFFMWAGAHDSWAPDFASVCIEALQKTPGSVSAFPTGEFFDIEGRTSGLIHTAYASTDYIPAMIRPWFTAWALLDQFAYQIYGVHRTTSLRQVSLGIPCYGPDLVCLFELAFLGSTVFVGGRPRVRMRQAKDYAEWEPYFGKIYGDSDITFIRVLRDTKSAYREAIRRHSRGIGALLIHLLCLRLLLAHLRPRIMRALRSYRPDTPAEEKRRLAPRARRLLCGKIPLRHAVRFLFKTLHPTRSRK